MHQQRYHRYEPGDQQKILLNQLEPSLDDGQCYALDGRYVVHDQDVSL